jgi:hypothetical protein
VIEESEMDKDKPKEYFFMPYLTDCHPVPYGISEEVWYSGFKYKYKPIIEKEE